MYFSGWIQFQFLISIPVRFSIPFFFWFQQTKNNFELYEFTCEAKIRQSNDDWSKILSPYGNCLQCLNVSFFKK
uniref:Uncharacterized protein n=1 Tax=Anguilla anguilla TaxID=7936 RepID=A0A0E9RZ27_ANGAN